MCMAVEFQNGGGPGELSFKGGFNFIKAPGALKRIFKMIIEVFIYIPCVGLKHLNLCRGLDATLLSWTAVYWQVL